ncbi:hypothetical protein DUNSADRAFT_13891 [Dunaliella salina]|uniref:Encoded protein n=1 Tax=Dunaliella salina TaxID=3046 RepID=A0ABQ7G8G7_DUNSA|nr:hypothetical protein DUNSADRAFT_13891 [Dunaliella salina]|eukprot:KAF5830903.1 hypothetical protein DUNSADRAFT_13891 [Dunaliella salina]
MFDHVWVVFHCRRQLQRGMPDHVWVVFHCRRQLQRRMSDHVWVVFRCRRQLQRAMFDHVWLCSSAGASCSSDIRRQLQRRSITQEGPSPRPASTSVSKNIPTAHSFSRSSFLDSNQRAKAKSVGTRTPHDHSALSPTSTDQDLQQSLTSQGKIPLPTLKHALGSEIGPSHSEASGPQTPSSYAHTSTVGSPAQLFTPVSSYADPPNTPTSSAVAWQQQHHQQRRPPPWQAHGTHLPHQHFQHHHHHHHHHHHDHAQKYSEPHAWASPATTLGGTRGRSSPKPKSRRPRLSYNKVRLKGCKTVRLLPKPEMQRPRLSSFGMQLGWTLSTDVH